MPISATPGAGGQRDPQAAPAAPLPSGTAATTPSLLLLGGVAAGKPGQRPIGRRAKAGSDHGRSPCHLPSARCPLLPPPGPVSRVGVRGPSPGAGMLPAAPPPHLGNRLPSLPSPLCRHQALHVANGGDFLLSGGTWKVLSCVWVFFFLLRFFFFFLLLYFFFPFPCPTGCQRAIGRGIIAPTLLRLCTSAPGHPARCWMSGNDLIREPAPPDMARKGKGGRGGIGGGIGKRGEEGKGFLEIPCAAVPAAGVVSPPGTAAQGRGMELGGAEAAPTAERSHLWGV